MHETNSLHILAVAVGAVHCSGAPRDRDIDSVPPMDTGRGPYDTLVHNLSNSPQWKIKNIPQNTIM
jgi:hypothetical protein